MPPVDDNQESQQRQSQRRVAERDRKRAAKACDNCRRQKEKCDGGVPCRRCLRLRRQCEFQAPSSRTGEAGPERSARQSNPTELEQRVGYLEKLLTHHARITTLDSENLRRLAESIDKPPRGRRSPDVQSHSSGYLGVGDENCTVQPLENNITHYSGEFSHWNFSMRIKQWVEQCAPDQSEHETGDTHIIKEYYRAEELQSASTTLTAALSSLPPRYVTEFLVDAFFKHAETNYFYVERGWLMQKLGIVYDNPASLTRHDISTVCILFIVFAIGTQYAYLDSREDQHGDPSRTITTGAGSFSEDALGVMFYQQACRLVPDVITIASLESVQGCLLIGLYTLPLDPSGLSYIYLNLAIKLAIQNGMHRKYPKEGTDPVVRETRNRVWWSAYATEKRIGIFHGRPISISSRDIDAERPADLRNLWPLHSEAHYHRMLATLQLNQALERISHEISTLRRYAKNEILDRLERLVDLKQELHNWWESLPISTVQREATPQSPVSRPDLHLKLEYYLVRMFAGRPFIFPRLSNRSARGSSGSPQEAATPSHTSDKPSPRNILVTDCVEAALLVIDTCQTLRSSIGLARASYTEFSACRAALLVIITQCLQKKTGRLRDALRQGMVMIKEMAAGGESASSEASLIEAFERAIARLDTAESISDASNKSDYSHFKRWEMLWKTGSLTNEIKEASSHNAHMPLPPQLASLPQGPLGGPRNDNWGIPLTTPFFSAESNFPTFNQPIEELSSVFGLEFEPNVNSGWGSGGGGVGSESLWMLP